MAGKALALHPANLMEGIMKPRVGLWIDHAKAVIVSITDLGETLTQIESNVGSRVKLSSGSESSGPHGPFDMASESRADQRFQQRLQAYYRDVVHAVRDAEALYVFGPGEAKTELGKEIARVAELRTRVARIETADKLTDRQIAAKVRRFFAAAAEPNR